MSFYKNVLSLISKIFDRYGKKISARLFSQYGSGNEKSFIYNILISIYHSLITHKLRVIFIPKINEGGLYYRIINRKLNHSYELFVPFDDISIFNEVIMSDMYQKCHQMNKGDVVIDVGAHHGYFSILALMTIGKEGKLIAIEPSKRNYRILKRNLSGFPSNNYIIIRKGIWSKKDNLKLYLWVDGLSHSLIMQKRNFTMVPVDTLDNILKNISVNRVDFLKMDIEGAEIEAFKGLINTITNNKIKLSIAAYHTLNNQPTCNTLAPMIESLGFKVFIKDFHIYASNIF
jgi:FkbM family methyltransferase